MNTWFTEIVRDANERLFSPAELDRIMAYYSSMPARLKAAEEIEVIDADFNRNLLVEMRKKFPNRELYSKRVILDLLDGLRVLAQALLMDEPQFLRDRWIFHLIRVIEESGIDPDHVRDVYVEMGNVLNHRLSASSRELMGPLLQELIESTSLVPSY